MNIAELNKMIKDAQEKMREEIPWNAYRFFVTSSKDNIDFANSQISFGGDYFEVTDPDFKECLEFWVKQAGGKVKW